MAKLSAGIAGNFVGTAGNLTGYMRNGVNFVRSRRKKNTTNNRPARLAQQQKITVCNVFTKPFCGTGFFNKTFPAYGHTGTGYNRATGAIMNLAITGIYPNIALSYPHVLVSKGSLPAAENAAAAVNAEGNILFTWSNNSDMGTAKSKDKAILVAYFPAKNMAIFSLQSAERGAMKGLLQTAVMKGETAHTWAGFLSSDEKDASCSVYTGSCIIL